MQNAISAGHEITLATAKEILIDGGNAFDAAIAAYAAMFITEPCMASAGGNGFALSYTPQAGCKMLDFFCQTPRTKNLNENTDYYPVTIDFGEEKEIFNIGLGSVAVPGAIAAMFKLHEMYGTIPMRVLLEPARKLAREGVVLNEFQAFDLDLLEPIFSQDDEVKHIFFNDEGIKKQGDLIRMPELDDFLDFISREGRDGFYKGEISRIIDEQSKNKGGFIRRIDLEAYDVNVVQTLKIPFLDYKLQLPNAPSKGGLAAALMLAYFEKSPTKTHLAIKKAQTQISDIENAIETLNKFYPDNNLDRLGMSSSNRGTSHFNIIDAQQNAICLTSSIGEGCGFFIPGTAMHLNNMLGESFLLPNGDHSWNENTRLNSMMTPSMLLDKNGNVNFIAGSGGASRIPYAIAQVLINVFHKKMNLIEATNAPRCHFQNEIMHYEQGAIQGKLESQFHQWEEQSLYFGGVHSIVMKDKRAEAYGDPRRFGVADVF